MAAHTFKISLNIAAIEISSLCLSTGIVMEKKDACCMCPLYLQAAAGFLNLSPYFRLEETVVESYILHL